jgi:hypothetical protein
VSFDKPYYYWHNEQHLKFYTKIPDRRIYQVGIPATDYCHCFQILCPSNGGVPKLVAPFGEEFVWIVVGE